AYAAAQEADAVVILTEWNEFRALDLTRLREGMKQPLMIDLRNIYRAEDARGAGFEYVSVGRP
ncbi:MAG: UDP binding domain-containing protein, partial [Pseudomonadota bacterium]